MFWCGIPEGIPNWKEALAAHWPGVHQLVSAWAPLHSSELLLRGRKVHLSLSLLSFT